MSTCILYLSSLDLYWYSILEILVITNSTWPHMSEFIIIIIVIIIIIPFMYNISQCCSSCTDKVM